MFYFVLCIALDCILFNVIYRLLQNSIVMCIWSACPSSPMRLKIRIDPLYDSFKDIKKQTKVEIVEPHFMTPSRT